MVQFSTVIKKFSSKGEKTGWTYIEISEAVAQMLKPNNKKSFRVIGSLDNYKFEGLALIPMGEGVFILALNASIRKKIGKQQGAKINIKIEVDNNPVTMNEGLMECLADEPDSLSFFNTLAPGHRKYFSNWIESAKTEETKTKRIALTINALSKKWDYGQMIRDQSAKKRDMLL